MVRAQIFLFAIVAILYLLLHAHQTLHMASMGYAGYVVRRLNI